MQLSYCSVSHAGGLHSLECCLLVWLGISLWIKVRTWQVVLLCGCFGRVTFDLEAGLWVTPPNDLLCVEWDIKLYTLAHLPCVTRDICNLEMKCGLSRAFRSGVRSRHRADRQTNRCSAMHYCTLLVWGSLRNTRAQVHLSLCGVSRWRCYRGNEFSFSTEAQVLRTSNELSGCLAGWWYCWFSPHSCWETTSHPRGWNSACKCCLVQGWRPHIFQSANASVPGPSNKLGNWLRMQFLSMG